MASVASIRKDAEKSLAIRKFGRERTVTADDGTETTVFVPGRVVRTQEEFEAAEDMSKRAEARLASAKSAHEKVLREIAEAEQLLNIFTNVVGSDAESADESDAEDESDDYEDDEDESDDETEEDDESDDESDSTPPRVNGRFAKRS